MNDPVRANHCICNFNTNYLSTDAEDNCIQCYGIGHFLDEEMCSCMEEENAVLDPENLGHCICLSGFTDNGRGMCVDEVYQAMSAELNVFQVCIMSYLETTLESQQQLLTAINLVAQFDFELLDLTNFEGIFDSLEFPSEFDDIEIFNGDTFVSLSLVINILTAVRNQDAMFDIDTFNQTMFIDALLSANVWSLTEENIQLSTVTELVNLVTHDVHIASNIIGTVVVELPNFDLSSAVADIGATFNVFQRCIMNFITADPTLSIDDQFVIAMGLTTFDYTTLILGRVEDTFATLVFSGDIEEIIQDMASESRFQSLDLVMNMLLTFELEDASFNAATFDDANLVSITTADFWQNTDEIDVNILKELSDTISTDVTITTRVLSRLPLEVSYVEADLVLDDVLMDIISGFDIFQQMTMSFIFTLNSGLSMSDQIDIAMSLNALDYETMAIDQFSEAFSTLPFSNSDILNIANSPEFASINIVINVLLVLKLEDESFDAVTFDATNLMSVTSAEFWSQTEEDINLSVLSQLASAVSDEATITSQIIRTVSQDTEAVQIDPSEAIVEIEANLNIFQISVMEFITAIKTTLTEEERLSILLGLVTIDYELVELNNFAATFNAISFSSDPEFNIEIQELSTDERFASIEVVVNVLKLFTLENVEITELNSYDIASFATSEFWESTASDIDGTTILSIIESTGADASIITNVAENDFIAVVSKAFEADPTVQCSTDSTDGSDCSCDYGYISNAAGDLCIKCSGVLAQLEDDQCVCESPKAELHMIEQGLCICSENFFATDGADNCIQCYGIGHVFDGTSCQCTDVDNAEINPEDEGLCRCMIGFVDNGFNQCVSDEVQSLVLNLDVFQATIMSFFSEIASFSNEQQLQFVNILAELDFQKLKLLNFGIIFGGLSFPAEISTDVQTIIAENEKFASLTTVINLLVVITEEDPEFNIETFDKTSFIETIASAAVWSMTAEEMDMNLLVELTDAVTTDVAVLSQIATRITVEISDVEISVAVDAFRSDLDVFQGFVMDFIIAADSTLSLEEQFAILIPLKTFDASTVEVGKFAEAFSAITFSNDAALNSKIVEFSERAEFASIDLVINVLLTIQLEDPSFDAATFDTTVLASVISDDFWSTTEDDINIALLSELTVAVSEDATIVSDIIRRATVDLNIVDLSVAVAEIETDFNIFQTSFMTFITAIKTTLTTEQRFSIAVGLATFDYQSVELNQFKDAFATISFSSDADFNTEIQSMSEIDNFASIDLVVNVLKMFVLEDVEITELNNYSIDNFTTSEFWEKTASDIDGTIILELIESTGADSSVLANVVENTDSIEVVIAVMESTTIECNNISDDGCECKDGSYSNSAGDECIKCSGPLAEMNSDDECVCESSKTIPHLIEPNHCICNADEHFHLTDDGSDCIKCYGIGNVFDGTSCLCNTENNVEPHPVDEGLCVCVSDLIDNGAGECVPVELISLLKKLDVFQETIMSYFEADESFTFLTVDQKLEFVTALSNIDIQTVDLDNFETVFTDLSFESEMSTVVATIAEKDTFLTLSFIVNVLILLKDDMELEKTDITSFVESSELWSLTASEISLSMLEEFSAVVSSDVDVQASIVSKVILEVEVVELSISVSDVQSEFNIFQRSIMDFIIAADDTISTEQEFEIAIALSAFDSSSMEVGKFADWFRDLSISGENQISALADTAEFAAIDLVVNLLLTVQLEDTSFDAITFDDTELKNTLSELGSLTADDIDISVLQSLASTVSADISIVNKVVSSVSLNVAILDVSEALDEITAEFDVFQRNIMDFIITTLGDVSVEEQFLISVSFSSVDFTVVALGKFTEVFKSISFSENIDINTRIIELADSAEFSSIELVVNLLLTLQSEDESFDAVTFDDAQFATIVTVDFWSKTAEDIDLSVVHELMELVTTDIAIVNKVVAKVSLELSFFDVSVALIDARTEFDVFQRFIMDFILAFPGLSTDDHFIISIALATFDSTTLSLGTFVDEFKALSFSSDEAMNSRFVDLADTAQFGSVDLLINLLVQLQSDDDLFDATTFDDTELLKIASGDFWTITGGINISLVSELASAVSDDVEVVSKIVQSLVIDLDIIDLETVVTELETNFNIFQTSIIEYIKLTFTTLSTEEKFSVYLAVETFDFEVVEINEFVTTFAAMSFSSDTDLNSQIQDLSKEETFASIDLVVNVLKLFLVEGVIIKELNTYDLTSFITEEFWANTEKDIDGTVVLGLIEATGADVSIIEAVVEQSKLLQVVLSLAEEVIVACNGNDVGSCDCDLGYISNTANTECIKCSGVLSELTADDECSCQVENGAMLHKIDPNHCICNSDDYYHETDASDNCIRCYGIGHVFDGTSCECNAEANVEFSTEDGENGFCVCQSGFVDNGYEGCISEEAQDLMKELSLFQSVIVTFFQSKVSFTGDQQLLFVTTLADLNIESFDQTNFETVFGELTFSDEISADISVIATDSDQFAILTFVINVITIIQEENVSFDVDDELAKTNVIDTLATLELWSLSIDELDVSLLQKLVTDITPDVEDIQNIVSRVTVELGVIEISVALAEIEFKFDVFQRSIMDFIVTSTSFSVEEKLQVALSLTTLDYTTLTFGGFTAEFNALSFSEDLSDQILALVDSDQFATIELVVNVLLAVKLEDDTFDAIKFDDTNLVSITTTEFWETAASDLDILILSELAAAVSEDTVIVNSIITQVTLDLVIFNVDDVLSEIVMELNVFQASIMNFIYAVRTETLTIEEQFTLAIALKTFDYQSVVLNEFGDAFAEISFSSDENFNGELKSLKRDTAFVSLDLVMNVLTLFVEESIDIETLTNYNISLFTTEEFWKTTEIDATIVFDLIESASADASIVASVVESSVTITEVESFVTEFTALLISNFDGIQAIIYEFVIENGDFTEDELFFVATGVTKLDFTTVTAGDLSASFESLEFNADISERITVIMTGDEVASLEFFTNIFAAFIENGITIDVISAEIARIGTEVFSVSTTEVNFEELKKIIFQFTSEEFTTEITVKTLQTSIMFGDYATDINTDSFIFQKQLLISYFTQAGYTDEDLLKLTIALEYVDDENFSDLENFDIELVYLETELFSIFSESFTTNVLLQFAMEFTAILETTENVDIVLLSADLLVYFESIWSETSLTYDIMNAAITSLEEYLEENLDVVAEIRMETFDKVTKLSLLDVEEFSEAVTAIQLTFNVFQKFIMDYIITSISFSVEEEFLVAVSLTTLDYTSLTFGKFAEYNGFDALSISKELNDQIIALVDTDKFITIELVVDVLLALEIEDDSFDAITFDDTNLVSIISDDFWENTASDLNVLILSELAAAVSTDSEIVNSIITQVSALDLDVFKMMDLSEIEMELNAFQASIMDFVMTIKTTLTTEQQLSIAIALQSFDYQSIELNEFVTAFAAISFSTDEDFNLEIQSLVDDDRFVSIDLVVNVLLLFVEESIDIETINNYEISIFTTAEFWENTDIDATTVLNLIESTGADESIVTIIVEKSVTITIVESFVTELTAIVITKLNGMQAIINEFFIGNGIFTDSEQFLIAIGLTKLDFTTVTVDALSTALESLEFHEDISESITTIMAEDKFASLEFLVNMFVSFIDNGITVDVLSTEITRIGYEVLSVWTTDFNIMELSNIVFQFTSAEFTTEIKVKATIGADLDIFIFQKQLLISYFTQAGYTEEELLKLTIALKYVDNENFSDLENFDIELIYLEDDLLSKFLVSFTTDVMLQFAMEFTAILETTENVDIVLLSEDLLVYFESIWSETTLTYTIIQDAMSTVETYLESSVIFETRVAILHNVVKMSVFDAEVFIEELTADFNIFQNVVMFFFSLTQSSDELVSNVAVGLMGFDAALVEVGNLAQLLETLDFGDSQEVVIAATTATNFVTIEFVVNVLYLIQEDESIEDMAALNLLQTELESFDFELFFNNDEVTYEDFNDMLSVMTTIEDIKVSIIKEVVITMAIFDIETIVEEIEVSFNIFQLTMMNFYNSMSLSTEQRIEIAWALFELDFNDIELGNLEVTISGLESHFGSAWTVVLDSFESFDVVSVLVDILVIFKTEVADFDDIDALNTLDIISLFTESTFWLSEVDITLVETIVTHLTTDVSVQSAVIWSVISNVDELNISDVITTFDIYHQMLFSYFQFHINDANDEQVEFELLYILNNLDLSLTEDLYSQISDVFSSEVFVSAITSKSFNSIVFAVKLVSTFEAESVSLTTLTIDEYFTGDFWNTEKITLDVINAAILKSGVTDQIIITKVFIIAAEYINVTFTMFQQILFNFGEFLTNEDETSIVQYIALSTSDFEDITFEALMENINVLFESGTIEYYAGLHFVFEIAKIDISIITDKFITQIDRLDVFSLTADEISFDIFEKLAKATSNYDMIVISVETILAEVFVFDSFQTSIMSFFKEQTDVVDVKILREIMFMTVAYDYTTTEFADFTVDLEELKDVTDVTEAESFTSLKFVISIFIMLIEAGADVVDLVIVEETIQSEIQWSMTIVELTFEKFSTVVAAFASETMKTKTVTKIINTVTEQYSVVMLKSATINIYQETVMQFMIEQHSTFANQLALQIITADFVTDNAEGRAFRVLESVLSSVATSASIDIITFRTDVLFSTQFASITFVYEVINSLIETNFLTLEELSDTVISQSFFDNILWTYTVEDITMDIYTKMITQMTTIDASIADMIDEAKFGVFLDYAFVSTEFFCENNNLNLGDYMSTGQCNCIDNAETSVDPATDVTSCDCSDGFTMVTSGDSRSCDAGKDRYCLFKSVG